MPPKLAFVIGSALGAQLGGQQYEITDRIPERRLQLTLLDEALEPALARSAD